jgi:cytochrome b subunit of formate dehydrogenase
MSMATKSENYARFSVFQRVEHWILTLSFTLLAVTGLPQRYALSGISDSIIAAFGGLDSTRVIHHVAAIVMIAVFLVHLVEVAYKFFVLRLRPTMLPTPRDVTDALQALGYNLGLVRQPLQLPRYNFAEKAEYWAVMWGTAIMALTGFMLWNPITTTKYLPGQTIPAAKVAHSSEAVLAVLAIIVWHFYWAHFKTLNLSMLNGKLSAHQMMVEHDGELAEIRAGVRSLPVSAETLRRRSMLFVPVAAIVAIVVLVGLYLFITHEETAIATVPPAETAPVFVRATPSVTNTRQPSPTDTVSLPVEATAPVSGTAPAVVAPTTPVAATQVRPVQIPHALQGRENCLQCHAIGGALPEPASHASYALGACLICHTTAGPGPLPAPVAHTLQGRADCAACHTGTLLPTSHTPANFKSADCLTCHAGAAPSTAASPVATAPTAAATGAQTVTVSAAAPTSVPMTATVAAATEAAPAVAPTVPATATVGAVVPMTTTAAATATQASPVQIPHALDGRENCLQCHAIGGALPEPANHASYIVGECLICHTTAGPGPLPKPAPHTLQGRADCTACHTGTLLPTSHTPANFKSADCLSCHAGAASSPAASPAALTPPAASTVTEAANSTASAPSTEVRFARDLQPLLQRNCGLCHRDALSGGLKVTDYGSLMKGGATGPVVKPGAPDESPIVAKMNETHPKVLTGADLQTLIDWIAQGAKDN